MQGESGTQRLAFSVRPLADADSGDSLLLVSFDETAPPPPAKVEGKPEAGRRKLTAEAGRIAELEQELAYTKENLRATIEEQQTSNEELKSANEEMQSTNEELQSTNEELETSKEELQSVNEELVTVNAELQGKIEQLASMQNDMKNLLDNISVGTIFLDEQLRIRRFTRDAASVYRLVASDVGRPLADIKSDFAADLNTEARGVLDTLLPWQCELQSSRGAWYLARIQPYRTLENVIEGVVLTFTDISERVVAESALREQRAMALAGSIVNTLREPLLVLDEAQRVIFASSAFYREFQVRAEDTVGQRVFDLGDRQWDIPALRELLESILPRNSSFEGYAVEHDFPAIGRRRILLNARRVIGKPGESGLILLAMEMMPIPKIAAQ
jgi:two-component system CheB/CheR fusion protein